ncbi:hypothetical protein EDC01DRAFT_774715 [Geopyxis carbonaria]|nr:hypothetical protein EDC01DRAFT_774715 [Geopyxis carbonaria]
MYKSDHAPESEKKKMQEQQKEEEEPELCAICIRNLDADSGIRLAPCSHNFHIHCFGPWVRACDSKNLPITCPLCRTRTTQIDPLAEDSAAAGIMPLLRAELQYDYDSESEYEGDNDGYDDEYDDEYDEDDYNFDAEPEPEPERPAQAAPPAPDMLAEQFRQFLQARRPLPPAQPQPPRGAFSNPQPTASAPMLVNPFAHRPTAATPAPVNPFAHLPAAPAAPVNPFAPPPTAVGFAARLDENIFRYLDSSGTGALYFQRCQELQAQWAAHRREQEEARAQQAQYHQAWAAATRFTDGLRAGEAEVKPAEGEAELDADGDTVMTG